MKGVHMKKYLAKFYAIIPAFALVMGILSARSACLTFFHQPETPDAMNAYRK